MSLQLINTGRYSSDPTADTNVQAFNKINQNYDVFFAGAGSTGSRPAAPGLGAYYFDTTLGWPVWWNGSSWVNATGAIS